MREPTSIRANLLLLLLSALTGFAEPVSMAIVGDPKAAALIDALTPRFDGRTDVALVERPAIEALLKEQARFKQPAELGRLLDAQLLLMIQQDAIGQRIALLEAGTGLRLDGAMLSDRVLEERAAVAEAFANRSIGKYREGIRAVFAIPPFTNRDLVHDYDHLQNGLARLAQEYLTRTEGVLVVEFEHAHDLLKESLLPGNPPAVERIAPFYIEGSFQSGRRDGRPRFTLTLKQHRLGQEQLREKKFENVEPYALPKALRTFLEKCLADAGQRGAALKLGEPTRAGQLAEKAKRFRVFGHHNEALALYEAALLLQPDRFEWCWEAAGIAAELTASLYNPYVSVPEYHRRARRAAAIYQRGVNHLMTYLAHKPVADTRVFNGISTFWAAADYFRSHDEGSEEIRTIFYDIENRKRLRLIELIKQKHKRGELTDRTLDWAQHYLVRGSYPSVEDKYAERWEMIRLIKDLPLARQWIKNLIDYEVPRGDYKEPAYLTLLEEVGKLSGGKGKEIIAEQQFVIGRYFASLATWPEVTPVTPEEKVAYKKRITLDPLTFEPPPDRVAGWLNCGAYGDIAWEPNRLHLLREKGKLETIHAADERFHTIVHPVFDGRYAWFPVTHRLDPLVLLVDPETGDTRSITAADGLLPMSHDVTTAVIGSNRIMIAARYGKELSPPPKRSWCGIVTVKNSGEINVDAFYITPSDENKNNGLLIPRFMHSLIPEGQAKPSTVVLKYTLNNYMTIDPASRKVTFRQPVIGSSFNQFDIARRNDQLYWCGRNDGRESRPAIWNIGLPDPGRRKRIQDAPADGLLGMDGRKVYLAGTKRWWVADGPDKPFVEAAVAPPEGAYYYNRFFNTHHYGLVYLSADGRSYQVDCQDL